MLDIHKIDWSTVPWEKVREGVERKAFSGTGATVALNRLQPGHKPGPHSHMHEQIVYIIQGRMNLHVGDQVIEMGPGSLAVVPPNVTHYGLALGTEAVLNLDVFTPKRPEYAQ